MNNPWKPIKAPSKDVSALRADSDHPLELFWAKDHIGRYLFVYEYPSKSNVIIKNPPELVGIETISRSANNEISRLILILREKANWEMFYSLCSDLLNATASIKTPETASATILSRLRRWQEFLKKKRSDILPEEEIKGLIGELIYLKNQLIPKYGCTDAVKFWQGPEGTPQDFNINESAVEVKCQLGGTTPKVKISSVDQLYSQLPKLYLFVVTLAKSTADEKGSINLPAIINAILELLEAESSHSINRFQDLLLEAGYLYNEKYLEFNYLLSEVHAYSVKDNFPRIKPTDVQPGIIRLNYDISLSECAPFEIDINKWRL